MARIRSIKPEFPQSESMGRVSRDARLTFIQLWTLADDEGRLRGNSRMLASLLFPYDDDAKDLIDGWLAELEREHCIQRYQIEGDSYIQIANWLIHQKIDKPSKSKIPEFVESSRKVAKPRERSSEDHGSKDQGSKEGSAIPEWVPADAWKGFVAMRAKIKKPLTDRAVTRMVNRLSTFRDKGLDLGELLDEATAHCWQDIYEPKQPATNGADSPWKGAI